jgi:alkanesulfonate monooxygenase SsuD/methylene tetrahydromethanopterin reductase-like flavin-dependent oxidoreductase (luciferase family)
MQILIYGNLLPIHDPLRLAEELSMLDCLTGGRLISGVARGIPREYTAYNVSLADSRARFEEAWEIIKRAWTQEVFSYEGKYWTYRDVAIWPRPVQTPHPPVWVPVTTSQETLEWAARENAPITPGAVATLAARQDMVRYYADCLARHGRAITPDHIVAGASVYIADSREQALREAGPYMLYFFHTLFSHGNISNVGRQRESGYVREEGLGWLRPEHRDEFLRSLQGFRRVTMADLEKNERLCWGSPAQVRDALLGLAEALGSNTLLVQFNQGAMPHEMFVRQIERFASDVLPEVKEHTVAKVAVA